VLTSFIEQIKCSSSITSFISNEKLWMNRNNDIYIFSCDFRVDQYQQSLFDELGVVFPSDLSMAVSKRQAEFLAGRYAAKEAMRNSNIDKETVKTVGIGSHRCPIWPNKFTGSITHNNSKAICAVTGSDPNVQLGIDFESYISNTAVLEIENSIHSNDEKQLLINQGISGSIATTIIFSAKESLFKALYPKVKKYFGFEEARVKASNVKGGYLILAVANDLVNECFIANRYVCYFCLTEVGVFTFIYNSNG
jgi:enterobactin synthetase component D